jgi:hypothetical protein
VAFRTEIVKSWHRVLTRRSARAQGPCRRICSPEQRKPGKTSTSVGDFTVVLIRLLRVIEFLFSCAKQSREGLQCFLQLLERRRRQCQANGVGRMAWTYGKRAGRG